MVFYLKINKGENIMKKICFAILIVLMIIYLSAINVYAADLNLALYTS